MRILSRELPAETTLIGFAGAPWTVATYMIAGRGTPDQGPAHALKAENRALFEALIERITEATIDYLSTQVEAGAEVVKLFDSWAGSLKGEDFNRYALEPAQAHHRGAEGAPPRPAGHRLPARGGGGLHRLCQGHRRRLRGARQFGVARTGRPSMCRPTAACRATSRRGTW